MKKEKKEQNTNISLTIQNRSNHEEFDLQFIVCTRQRIMIPRIFQLIKAFLTREI